jgi:hypothetical protein
MIAGIELGGTKTVVATGSPAGEILEICNFPTTDPQSTLAFASRWLAERGHPSAIGVAAFGPIGLTRGSENFGRVLATPKPGWSGFSLLGTLAAAFPQAKLALETDVNAAALAEARVGAAAGMDDVVYITIGTGIGGGVLSGSRGGASRIWPSQSAAIRGRCLCWNLPISWRLLRRPSERSRHRRALGVAGGGPSRRSSRVADASMVLGARDSRAVSDRFALASDHWRWRLAGGRLACADPIAIARDRRGLFSHGTGRNLRRPTLAKSTSGHPRCHLVSNCLSFPLAPTPTDR